LETNFLVREIILDLNHGGRPLRAARFVCSDHLLAPRTPIAFAGLRCQRYLSVPADTGIAPNKHNDDVVIEAWMRRTKNPYTRQTYLGRLNTLFSFALRRGYVSVNPCVRIERVTIDLKPPLVLKPDQAQALFDLYPTRLKPYVIFGMYAGVRPEEIQRLDWSAVNMKTKTVKVDGNSPSPHCAA
jgi:integrase